jgi:hypothetical protein
MTPTRQINEEFRYIAFDEETRSAIGYGRKAVLALQYADLVNSQSSIFVIEAGRFGYNIWAFALNLTATELLISAERESAELQGCEAAPAEWSPIVGPVSSRFVVREESDDGIL